MTTVGTMVERVRREILGGHRMQLNVLASAYTAGSDSLALGLPLAGISLNQYVVVDDEIMWVKAFDRNAQSVSVISGLFGTAKSAHANGALVEVGARYPKPQLKDTMFEEIASWPPSIYRVGSVALTYTTGIRGYDLTGVPSDFYDVLEVLRSPAAGMTASDGSWPRARYRLERNVPYASYPSGSAVFVDMAAATGTSMQVIYNYPFTLDSWTDATDLENDVGLSSGHLDILKWGVLWRLAGTAETPRSDPSSNHDDRSEQALPAGLNINNTRSLLALRDRRISDEAKRIIRIWKLPGW